MSRQTHDRLELHFGTQPGTTVFIDDFDLDDGPTEVPAGADIEWLIEYLNDRLSRYEAGVLRRYASFTIDAWLSSGRFFFADAVILAVRSGSFTADAYIVAPVTGGFTADAILRALRSSGITADAVLRRTQSGGFTADAVLRHIVFGGLTGDAVLLATVSGTIGADAVIGAAAGGSSLLAEMILGEDLLGG